MKIFIIILIIAGVAWFYFRYLKNLGFFKNLFKKNKAALPAAPALSQFLTTQISEQVLVVKCPKCNEEFILEKKSKRE